MLSVPAGDDSLRSLRGAELASSVYPGVGYRLERLLGAGSMAVAFFAERRSPTGSAVAVIKVTRPEFVRAAAETALLTIRKESVALGRLNERVPPTPFVVRFIESGETPIRYGPDSLVLPWLAMEYVHGNTLEQRIEGSVAETGAAFDPERAALCVESIAQGLDAVHGVQVLHRDIKPNNILCCGVFPDEVFKLSDFGVARPMGLRQTFLQGSMGTLGYASPEQITTDEASIGPASDVFSLAATTFSVLTGEDLFPARNVLEALEQAKSRERRSIRDTAHLAEELRSRPEACAALDDAIAHATAPDARDRPQSASIFAGSVLAVLRTESVRSVVVPVSRRRAERAPSLRPAAGWNWKVRHAPGDQRAIRSVSWDASGCCLAATASGLAFWNGTEWAPAPLDADTAHAVRFVHHTGPDLWLIGGDGGLLAYYSSRDQLERLRRPPVAATFEAASGRPEDLAAVFGTRAGGPPLLFGITGKRWMKELTVPAASYLLGLCRFDEERWLVVGRGREGTGLAGIYAPLRWEVDPLPVPGVRAFTACAAVPEVGSGIVVGAGGQVVRVDGAGVHPSVVPGAPDLSGVVLELNQRAWTTSIGRIWMQTPQHPDAWTCAWEDAGWQVPIVSLFADGRRVIGVGADGGVIEGCEY